MKEATKPNRNQSQFRVNAPCYSFKIAGDKGINLFNCDWRELLPTYEDNHFKLAIVDPQYGISESLCKRGNVATDKWKNPAKTIHKSKEWDLNRPDKKYFDELFRVSKNQIIWGGNYFVDFISVPSMGWVFWDKKNGNNDFSDGELAYTSFDKGLRKFSWLWNGFQKQKPEKRIHPTQKPVALYRWLLQNYANEGDKILDTHLGSGSIAIACYEEKFDLTACEIDEEYFEAMKNRVEEYRKQLQLF